MESEVVVLLDVAVSLPSDPNIIERSGGKVRRWSHRFLTNQHEGVTNLPFHNLWILVGKTHAKQFLHLYEAQFYWKHPKASAFSPSTPKDSFHSVHRCVYRAVVN